MVAPAAAVVVGGGVGVVSGVGVGGVGGGTLHGGMQPYFGSLSCKYRWNSDQGLDDDSPKFVYSDAYDDLCMRALARARTCELGGMAWQGVVW